MHACKNIALAGTLFLMIVLLLPDLATAISPAINPTPSVVSGLQSSRSVTNVVDSDYYTFPGELPDTLRVLAIRVHFQPDTLSMTFGDGDFMYDFPDTVNPDGWILDSPPHDKQFFLDQLLAARNYFSKYSYGNLTLAGIDNVDEGGDVYPRIDDQSYLLDYPIWTINYGNDDHERLNQRLVDLFVDAWTLADSDPDVSVVDYDLFIVFHAGAGNEFDTGFDMTPFDIPSVFISESDLAEFGDLPDGIQMNDGIVPNGIILPETQRQLGVDVGMHGTVVAQIGFAIGLPHLYNTENGDAGIGMLGLMDRGFGAYFGTIPIPPCAWSRIFMGWDEPVTVSGFSDTDTVHIGGLHLPDDVFSDNLDTPGNVVRLLRIPINNSEYYLAEARMRDPDEDSLAFGWDRDGRMITFHDDYSWEAEEGFRVAVEYSDHDFDLPASGVLLWHVDDKRIRNRYGRDDLQNSFDYRAIRLEEADGVWDIGNDYPFLTAGDGTEYGYFADAFYRDNEFWRETNRPLFNPQFGTNTAPSSISNDGGFTHITLSHFSDIGDTMSFDISNSWVEDGFPADLDWESVYDISAGDFNGDGVDEIALIGRMGYRNQIAILDSSGSSPYDLSVINDLDNIGDQLAIADMDIDGADDLIVPLRDGMFIVQHDADSGGLITRYFEFDNVTWFFEVAVAKADNGTPFAIAQYSDESSGNIRIIAFEIGDDTSEPSIDTTFVDYSVADGWGYTLVSDDPQAGPDAIIWMPNLSVVQLDLLAGVANFIPSPRISDEFENFQWNLQDVIAADFSGDGETEYIGSIYDGYLVHLEFTDPEFGPDSWPTPHFTVIPLDERPFELLVTDLDNDGLPEPTYRAENWDEYELIAVELNGILSEGSPLSFSRQSGNPIPFDALTVDSDGDGNLEWITTSIAKGDSWPPRLVTAYDLQDGRVMPGFPIAVPADVEAGRVRVMAANLDSDSNLELVTVVELPWKSIVTTLNLPGFSGDKQLVWSEPGGNPANTRFTSIDLSQSGSRADFAVEDAYCWPNPVLAGDVAHFRYPGSMDEVEVVIYDLAGREKLSKRASSQSGGLDTVQAEIEMDVSSLPSGVYVARLVVGDEVKQIRFAVVN